MVRKNVMRSIILIIGLLIGAYCSSSAQYLSLKGMGFLGIANNSGAEYFYNGGGFALSYQQELTETSRLNGGVEYRIINWGHQVALQLGYDYAYWQQGPWRAAAFGQVQAGSALYVQKGLFTWGAGVGSSLEWKSPKAFFASLSFGARVSHCPAYLEYGGINVTLDLPIQLGIGFKLGNRKD